MSYGPWDHKELDTTEQLTQSHPSAAGNVPGISYIKQHSAYI